MKDEIIGRQRIALTALVIFAVAAGVRFLTWQDQRFTAGQVQSGVVANYRHAGRLLREGGVKAFFSPSSPFAADTNHLGHPPGYPVLLACVSGFAGETDAAVQWFQMLADAAAAVVIFLIALQLVPTPAAAILAGLFAALSPQLAYNSVLLLPDTLAALPLLLAVYCLARARRRPRLLTVCAAGVCVGLSCWLRANALLFAPFLAAAVVPLLFPRGRRLHYALALAVAALLTIAPITIRNALVHRRLIPLSLGAGQTLLEGIADYDPGKTLGVPETDLGITRKEAETYRRPDYASSLFHPDGIERERRRLARGAEIIFAHPFWFAGVMARRAASMLKLERAPTVSTALPVTHAPAAITEAQSAPPAAWQGTPAELLAGGRVSPNAEIVLAGDGQTLRLVGDDSKWGEQFVSPPFAVREGTDYLLELSLRLERGRALLRVEAAGARSPLASAILDPREEFAPGEQPVSKVQLPFASGRATEVRVSLGNAATQSGRTVVEIGTVKLRALGESAPVWARYPRLLVAVAQWFFKTAWLLPLALIGLALTIRARRWDALLLLLAVPAYYMCIQSALHTEYRYILTLYYFLFVFAAVALSDAARVAWQGWHRITGRLTETGVGR